MNAEDWCYDHEKAEQVTYGVPQCRTVPASGTPWCNSLPASAGGPAPDWLLQGVSLPNKHGYPMQDPLIEKMKLLKKLRGEDYQDMGLNEQRVGTAERDRYIDHLTNMYAEGYLDMDEFSSRLDRASGAPTHGVLQRLVSDLPPLPTAPVRKQRDTAGLALRAALTLACALAVAGFTCLTWMLL